MNKKPKCEQVFSNRYDQLKQLIKKYDMVVNRNDVVVKSEKKNQIKENNGKFGLFLNGKSVYITKKQIIDFMSGKKDIHVGRTIKLYTCNICKLEYPKQEMRKNLKPCTLCGRKERSDAK